MTNEGKYLNLKPHVTSWSIYNINGPYVTENRIGTLAPTQFSGLSYQVLEDKGGNVYVIQTESFGQVAIWAGDSDSTFTTTPLYTSGASLPSGSDGNYLNLKPHVTSWSIYNVNGPYVTENRIGTLAPSQFGGLSYQILEDKGNHIYIIQTENFGHVAIWAGDSDSTFSSLPTYTDMVNGGGSDSDNSSGTGQYLNLHPHVPSWSIYNVNGPYDPANRIGTVAPAQFGGLSYAVLENPMTDIYLIHTEDFGQVAIWAGDNDGSITGSPLYAAGSYTGGEESGNATGTYLNLSSTVAIWSIYNVHGPYLVSDRIGTLTPAQFGGLSYRILETKGEDIYIIQTENFGKVAIWAGDSDSTFTSYPVYSTISSSAPLTEDFIDLNFPETVNMVLREEWGAQAVDFPRMDGALLEKKFIVIHHEAGQQPQRDSDYMRMRAVQNYHRNDLLWGDIGYHYAIGQFGSVMEGRPINYIGAHVGTPHNLDSIGVCLLGDFSYTMPTEAQITKLVPLLVNLCKTHGISPDNIMGHRDMDSNYGPTSCPGDYFYQATSRLETIRQRVKDELVEDPTTEKFEIETFLELMLGDTELFQTFNFIDFNLSLLEQEYRIAPNINLKVFMHKHLIEADHSFFTYLFKDDEAELDIAILDALEGRIDDIEFFNTKAVLNDINGIVKPYGYTKLSIGYDASDLFRQKLLINYEIVFNHTAYMGRKGPGATVKLTFEIEDYSFKLPDPSVELVSNEEIVKRFYENPEFWKVVTATGVFVVILLGIGKFGLPLLVKYMIPAFS